MSLKDALLKAGFKSTKAQNDREVTYKKDLKNSEKHQFSRNFCEVCQTTQPDVERFKHRNRLIDAQWICCNCADKNEIHDDYRVTAQSDFSKARKYRRQYGPTNKLDKNFKSGRGPQKNNQRRNNFNTSNDNQRNNTRRRNQNNKNRNFNK